MYIFVSEDSMLDWYSCQICYPLEVHFFIIITIIIIIIIIIAMYRNYTVEAANNN